MFVNAATTKEDMDADGIADRAYRIRHNPVYGATQAWPTEVPFGINAFSGGIVGTFLLGVAGPKTAGSVVARALGGLLM